jgi:GH18 family chitinase
MNKLAIVGGRDFNDYELMKKELSQLDFSLIVSGGAKGADSLAGRYSADYNIKIIEYFPDWNKHGKSAGYIRNKLIVDKCDMLIAFWDGNSRGTKHSIDLAKKQNKLLKIVKY